MLHGWEIVGAGLFALLGAALILGGLARWTRIAVPAATPGRARGERTAVFLFRGTSLLDATPEDRGLLHAAGPAGSDLAALSRLLAPHLGCDPGERLAALPPGGRLLLEGSGATLEAEGGDGTLRLALRLGEAVESRLWRASLEAALEELGTLRGIAEDAPIPIWALDAEGRLSWANRAYLDLAARARGTGPERGGAWPAEPIFDLPPPGTAPGQSRAALRLPDRSDPLWFEVTSLRRGTGTLHVAADVGGLVEAESARRQVVQALAQTFAHLRTGLAVFDRQRRLALFNPAFLDLTGLPAPFLSARPSVHAVLDRLRDAGVLPEPRDYASWREELAALEAAASRGAYCDTWTLPAGQTYRVTGRPQPDGALAFLFEDISAEVGLGRRLRSELDLAHAALDSVGRAMAGFGLDGTLAFANAAYRALWGDPAGPRGPGDLARERGRWEAACQPSPDWDALRPGSEGRLPLGGADLRHRDGRRVRLRSAPLPWGGRLLSFEAQPAVPTGDASALAPAAG